MTTIQKATNYKLKNENGNHTYWLSFDDAKTWQMVSRVEYTKGQLL